MIQKSFTLLLLLSAVLFSFAQKIKMDVVMGDEKIGEINAEKKAKGKNVQYEMTSNVEANLMFTVKVTSVTTTYWYNGTLTISRATRTSNVPGQSQTTTMALKDKMYMVTKNDVESLQPAPVTFCVTNLYFQEPAKQETVFSEIQAAYLPLKNMGNHQYQVTQPNGKQDLYTYLKGKLEKIETVIAGKNVVFQVM